MGPLTPTLFRGAKNEEIPLLARPLSHAAPAPLSQLPDDADPKPNASRNLSASPNLNARARSRADAAPQQPSCLSCSAQNML